jgi:MoaA/NifB/PqqE/SkfB family radical SAM enzyme
MSEGLLPQASRWLDGTTARRAGHLIHHARLRLKFNKDAPRPVPCAIFKVTDACNARCTSCNVGQPGYRPVAARMPRAAALRTVEQLAKHGVLFLGIVGGEPLLYAHIMDVLAGARDAGIRVNLNTHGGLIDADAARALAERRLGYASVSLDSPDPARNDLLRKGIRFEAAVAGIANLRAHSPATGLAIGMTLSRENLNDAAEMCRFAAENGVGYVKFQPMHLHLDQTTPGEDRRMAMALRAEDQPDILARLLDAQHAADRFGIRCNARMLLAELPDVLHGRRHLRCVAGRTVLFVDPNGRVGGCPEERTSGSLFELELSDLMAQEPTVFRRADACPQLASCFDTTYGELSHLQGRVGVDHTLDVFDRLLFYGQS